MKKSREIRLPNDRQRLAVVGRTGSGKTVAALWHLSVKDFDTKPWVIVDFKTDENINAIERARHITLDEVPRHKGIYIVHPLPGEEEKLELYLWKLWAKENIGVYIDEGYMVGNSESFRALLTQGRSKRIPMIVLSQRPAWISRFVFSEADFFQVFHLNDKRDNKTVEAFLPQGITSHLPDYHSHYYDVGRNSLHHFGPVPDENETLEVIHERLKHNRKIL